VADDYFHGLRADRVHVFMNMEPDRPRNISAIEPISVSRESTASTVGSQTWTAIMNNLLFALEILFVVAGIALPPGKPKLRVTAPSIADIRRSRVQ